MGTTDKTTHTLTCFFGEEESQTIRESGSQYGATWGSGMPFNQFQVEWKKVISEAQKLTRLPATPVAIHQ